MYTESEKSAEKADKSQLKTRLRFHLAHKFGDEKKLMSFHQELEDVVEDQVGLAKVRLCRMINQIRSTCKKNRSTD